MHWSFKAACASVIGTVLSYPVLHGALWLMQSVPQDNPYVMSFLALILWVIALVLSACMLTFPFAAIYFLMFIPPLIAIIFDRVTARRASDHDEGVVGNADSA